MAQTGCNEPSACVNSSWGAPCTGEKGTVDGQDYQNPEYEVENQMPPNTEWLESQGHQIDPETGGIAACTQGEKASAEQVTHCGAGCRDECSFCSTACGGDCTGTAEGGCTGCDGQCSGCGGGCASSCTGCTGSCRGGCEGDCNTLCNIGCKGGAMDDVDLKLNRIVEVDNIKEIFELIIYNVEERLRKGPVANKDLINNLYGWSPEDEEKLFVLYYNIPRLFEKTFLNYLGVKLNNTQSGTLILKDNEYISTYLGTTSNSTQKPPEEESPSEDNQESRPPNYPSDFPWPPGYLDPEDSWLEPGKKHPDYSSFQDAYTSMEKIKKYYPWAGSNSKEILQNKEIIVDQEPSLAKDVENIEKANKINYKYYADKISALEWVEMATKLHHTLVPYNDADGNNYVGSYDFDYKKPENSQNQNEYPHRDTSGNVIADQEKPEYKPEDDNKNNSLWPFDRGWQIKQDFANDIIEEIVKIFT